jgi:hypothetical protein
MSRKAESFWVLAATLCVVLAFANPAFAQDWDVQEKCRNTTGQDAHDLTKIVIGAGAVTGAINNQLGPPSITTHTPVQGGTTVSIIHWGPGGTPVPPGDWVWGCFNAAGSPRVGACYWTDEEGNFIGLGGVEVAVTDRRDHHGRTWVDIEHTWLAWTGTGYPPEPGDTFAGPMGPITLTDVRFALADHMRPLAELNDDLINDTDWLQLDDSYLATAGEIVSYDLGMLDEDTVVLLYFVAAGEDEGISTPTIQQFRPQLVVD